MASPDYEACIGRLLVHEGGFTNNPADPGGPTNFGITIYDYRKYVKPNADAADVRGMKLSEAKKIYRLRYWDAQRCDDLPFGLDDTLFDYGVNSGIGRSGKVLRRVLGLPDNTAAVTNEVLAELARRDLKAVIVAINNERLAFLRRLPTWPTFGTGWGRRVAEVNAFSLALVSGRQRPAIVQSAAGKGTVPAPIGARKAVTTAGASTAAGGGGLAHMLGAHTWETGLVVVAGVVALGCALAAVNHWHQARQEAPTPGLVPVPVLAT